MNLKRLPDFVRENFVEPRPTLRTARRWKGTVKMGGAWYIDLDVYQPSAALQALAREYAADPDVARLLE